jgi:cytochrome c oxidase subunit IV
MENVHTNTTAAEHHGEEHSFDTKLIWKTFRILLYITVFELILAISYYEITFSNPHLVKHILNGVFIILTLAKAFFIVAEFMHLRHEIRNLIMTIAVPAMLFLWFIGAFLWDGNSYKNLRNNYDRNHLEQSQQKVEKKTENKEHEAKKPGAMD